MNDTVQINSTDHWSKRTDTFLLSHLEIAINSIRIATGFFTIQGYDSLKDAFIGKSVHILVGFDETAKERLKEKLIDDILLYLGRWDAPNRREIVLMLVEKLERGELKIVEKGEVDFIDARIRSKDHAKIYIIDNDKVVVGSSNLTRSGLKSNVEGVGVIDEKKRVEYWVKTYEEYWNAPDTYDLSEDLLRALKEWLQLSTPYDVYLKTIQALVPDDNVDPPRDSYKMPVKYQQVVIERAIRQLKDWKGAMIVASTGLGKTVMATHITYRLRRERKVYNIVVFAPKAIRTEWEQALDSGGLSYRFFTRELLDQPSRKDSGAVKQMLNILERLDDKYIIIIDESHYYRNRIKNAGDGKERRSFKRLVQKINERKPYVLLLTATPYSKEIEDLNNQLYLLPHNAPPNPVNPKGQYALPNEFTKMVLNPETWRVHNTKNFFDDFINLPVCTVISTSQVAKNFAKFTAEGEYIEFGDEKRWLPKIEVQKVKVPLPLEKDITFALDKHYFKHKVQSFMSRGQWQRSEATIEQMVTVAWSSSIPALKDVIAKTIEDEYSVNFIKDEENRMKVLSPILEKLSNITYENDEKLLALIQLLQEKHGQGEKVLIFVERHLTAIYLEEGIQRLKSDIKVANIVQSTKDGLELKSEDEIQELIINFAPEANKDKIINAKRQKHYDVFISTDAYGAGVNLQDASTAISYDLAWTPDKIIQRAGRILRFWQTPRKVSLFVFVGKVTESLIRQKESQRIERRLRSLTMRTRSAEKFSEIPLFPDTERAEYNSLADLSSVTIENLGLLDITKAEEFSGVSRFLIHITELSQNQDYANQIPDDISSARVYEGDTHYLYLLVRYRGDFFWMLYDTQRGFLKENIREDEILDRIQCSKDTPKADISADEIELQAQKCKSLWCEKNEVSEDYQLVERICALYLLPSSDVDSISVLSSL